MIRPFAWGVIAGAAVMVMFLGHNGWLVTEQSEPKHVSPRFAFTVSGCEIDWPQFAKVCHYIDDRGNRLIHTKL